MDVFLMHVIFIVAVLTAIMTTDNVNSCGMSFTC